MSGDSLPAISIVMTAGSSDSELARCLDSLSQQTTTEPFETLVVLCDAAIDPSIRTAYPWARFLSFGDQVSKPKLLTCALAEARADILVVTEPYCYFPTDWVEKIRRAHRRPFGVIGGAVEYGGPDTLVGWASYFADYGPFMLPAASGPAHLLAGNHISYRRSVLTQAADSLNSGYAKVFVLWELERRGIQFFFDSNLVVWCATETSFRAFARRYYSNAVEFAATRARTFSLISRLGRILGTPLLPPLLLARRVCGTWEKRRYRRRLVQTVPLLAAFVLCWAVGELKGYLRTGRSSLR